MFYRKNKCHWVYDCPEISGVHTSHYSVRVVFCRVRVGQEIQSLSRVASKYSKGPACDTGTCLFSPFEVRMGESWIWVKPLDEGAEGARFSDDGLRAEVMVRWRPLSGKLERHKAAILAKGRVGAPGNWRKENLLNSRMEFMSLTWSLRMCTWWQKIARGNWNLNYLCS